MENMDLWLYIGFAGQLVFGSRFIVQWFMSEKKKKSYIPIIFWHISILGGIILLLYAIHKKDPVFIFGQGTGLFVYMRNLMLIKTHGTAVES